MNSNSIAERRNRHRPILPNAFLIGYTITFFIICYLLFPERYIQQYALERAKPSYITQFYLEKLNLIFPYDLQIRVALATQAIGLHQWERADHEINQLAMDGTLQNEVSRLQFLYAYNKAYQTPKGAERTKALEQLKSLLPALANLTLFPNEYKELGLIALSLESPSIALIFFEKTVKLKGAQPPSFYRDIAKVALQTSQYTAAAQYYTLAATTETRIEIKRDYYVEALKCYQLGNITKEAAPLLSNMPEKVIDNNAMLIYSEG